MGPISTPLLRHMYRQASQDPDRHSFALWQNLLHERFPNPEVHSVVCDIPPADRPARDAVVVSRYDAVRNTMTPLLWVECRVRGGTVEALERQAVESAKSCLERSGLPSLFVLTVVGVSFRVWLYEEDAEQLTSLYGSSNVANSGQYIDVDADKADLLMLFFELARTGARNVRDARERLLGHLVAQTNGHME
ncbi:hypothetical protein J3459_016531 [Metarhizium acridum]|uniref:Uncharacterized protein n=1 Tax=Metarhizium acridum (strain CQMa 102) TaxID=655827 RepID=E9EGK1_METAQ|nr:uncharacterized protein MAC_08999 [Metarhizium acridum CQMa 102]EFY84967.1 hypothetical protein MAC_08999 [Metarhizium acridum CQMa 102]KAG8411185.1 hypothetical protein J3459_016531 [Metarhizium acridum]KAG8411510.1 hypothetical protein J3458_015566 [Metarhizium acridum]